MDAYLYGVWSRIKTDRLLTGVEAEIHPTWERDFQAFSHYVSLALEDRPSHSHNLCRIDRNRKWEPGNLWWATRDDQAAYDPDTIQLAYNGRTASLREWAQTTGVDAHVLYDRVKRQGWSVEDTLITPVNSPKNPQRCGKSKP